MNLDEWINLGISNGVVNMPQVEEKTFEEIYKQWFLMKINVIKAQSCDRIEVTYNRYYAGSSFVKQNVSTLDEAAVIRFLTGVIVGWGNITAKEFARIYQIVNNVLVYARFLELGGVRLFDWEMIRRYVPEGKLVKDPHKDFAVPKADIEKLLHLVVDQDIYPGKRSACLCLVMNFYLGLRVGELASLTWILKEEWCGSVRQRRKHTEGTAAENDAAPWCIRWWRTSRPFIPSGTSRCFRKRSTYWRDSKRIMPGADMRASTLPMTEGTRSW